jgi:GH35 family endo-1,4-beta-xylanase
MEIGFSPHPSSDYRTIRNLGCRWGYLMVELPWVQPEEGLFDFSYSDPLVAEAGEADIELLAAVATTRKLFPQSDWTWRRSRGMMPDPGPWREFLRAMVARYRDVVRSWEIWSEPNCYTCNPMSYYDHDLYRDLLALSAEAIRSVDSSARIVLGGLWLNEMAPAYLDGLLATGDAIDHFDVFNWHLYPLPRTRESIPFPLWKDMLAQWIDFFRSRLPEGFPVWVTEFGIATRTPDSDILHSRMAPEIVGFTEEEQADWFSEFAEAASEEWGIGRLVWLRVRDDEDPTHHFFSTTGVLRPDGSEKPVARRVSEHQAAKGYTTPRSEEAG